MNDWQEEERFEEPYYEEEQPPQPAVFLADLQMPFWLKISLLSLVLALLLAVSFWSASGPFSRSGVTPLQPFASTTGADSAFSQAPTEVVPIDDVDATLIQLGRYYSNALNLSFALPSGWREVVLSKEDLPPGVTDVSFTLYNEVENCIIAAGTFDRGAADYVQTSFGGRVFSGVTQYDGNWFTNQSFHAERIAFSDDRRQFLSHELRHTYNLMFVDLLLFERDGASVPVRCDTDFVTFLASTEHHYLPKRYESYEAGEISLRGLSTRGGPGAMKLVFTSDIDGNTYSLADIPVLGFGSRLFLRGTDLYFIGVDIMPSIGYDQRHTLYRYDLETSTLVRMERPGIDRNPLITSLYVTPDSLYYLSASTSSVPCIDGPRYDCEQQLYRMPSNQGEGELLASSTPATHIMGYVDDQETLYMQSGYGDAGCVTTRVYVHAENETTEAARFGGCVGEPGYSEYESEMRGLLDRIDEVSVRAIRHSYGTYSASTFVPPWQSTTFVIVK